MKILLYNELSNPTSRAFKKTLQFLEQGDFRSADVKKIDHNLYRAKVDQSARLLFSLYRHQGETCCLVLEFLPNHEYEKSRFLQRGVEIHEDKIPRIEHPEPATDTLAYLNPRHSTFHLLDKIISFDDSQSDIYQLAPPLVVIGSAGSGKTALSLEKMKTAPGDVLYITQSPYLVQNSRALYFSHQYENEYQNISFLSFSEFLESLQVPQGREVTARDFERWFQRHRHQVKLDDAHKVFEEFRGVLTGSTPETACLSREDYLNLGLRQSIFTDEERTRVYDLFEKYAGFLQEERLYDPNLISHQYLDKVQPCYDFVVVDEVQDLTNVQLYLILQTLRDPAGFILCGDSNQIVHPNFFSWTKIKSLFHQHVELPEHAQLTRILHSNYRNAPEVTALANNILRIKQARFGSIDKESNYLVQTVSTHHGEVTLLESRAEVLKELNAKTAKSMHYAVLVMHPEQKTQAQARFNTPLVFSVQEAKGLEYENIILYHFIQDEEKVFRHIAAGLDPAGLTQERNYARAKDKRDKSLEVYKFYINALYVAVTRSVRNLYLIEADDRHPLLPLLGLSGFSATLSLNAQTSSLEDWQREARKLELQGKQEQAEAIRERILQQKSVPWPVYQGESLHQLEQQTFANPNDRKLRIALWEYALVYQNRHLMDRLATENFKPAQHPDKSLRDINNKHFLPYTLKNPGAVLKATEHYGLDHRNTFNMTPLMVGSRFGHIELVEKLRTLGADADLVQNTGLTAFQLALEQALDDPQYALKKLPRIYPILVPDSLSIQVDGKLVKLDNHLMEFMMLNLAMLLCYRSLGKNLVAAKALSTQDFLAATEHLPDSVLPARRKQRSYLSSILSKNEVNRDDKYNRKLFVRLRQGQYVLNPALQLRIGGLWYPIYRVLDLEYLHFPPLQKTNSLPGRDSVVQQKIEQSWRQTLENFKHWARKKQEVDDATSITPP